MGNWTSCLRRPWHFPTSCQSPWDTNVFSCIISSTTAASRYVWFRNMPYVCLTCGMCRCVSTTRIFFLYTSRRSNPFASMWALPLSCTADTCPPYRHAAHGNVQRSRLPYLPGLPLDHPSSADEEELIVDFMRDALLKVPAKVASRFLRDVTNRTANIL